MVTQCPLCRRWFRIAGEQAEAAHGLVRCGDCDTVFNALATLREQPPTGESSEALPAAILEPMPGAGTEQPVADAPDDDENSLPFETRPRASRILRWSWVAGLVVAALVLAGQLANANRYAIAQAPVAGRALKAIYRGLGAPIEPRLNLARYAIADVSLASTPGVSGTLRLDGRLINRAPVAQRLPLIELRLRDRRGDVVAWRLLLPSDYVPTTIGSLAAGHDLHFRIELTDPGAEATGFTLVLCRRDARAVLCRAS
ncbi:MAG: zinc-ribbon and DUF3426 domain-containing protein [Gammaproteobacteria bacterium]